MPRQGKELWEFLMNQYALKYKMNQKQKKSIIMDRNQMDIDNRAALEEEEEVVAIEIKADITVVSLLHYNRLLNQITIDGQIKRYQLNQQEEKMDTEHVKEHDKMIDLGMIIYDSYCMSFITILYYYQ